jgi:hypothetical protein
MIPSPVRSCMIDQLNVSACRKARFEVLSHQALIEENGVTEVVWPWE